MGWMEWGWMGCKVACNDQMTLHIPVPAFTPSHSPHTPSPPPFPRPAYLHWREGLQMGDSDSESDDDSRAIVGLNADWTKEMDAEQQ